MSSIMLTNCKLYYGNINGRALIPRAILYCSNQPFEDIRLSFVKDFPQMKNSGKFEFNQLPMLEIEGKCYVQSLAIIQLLARHFNLYGKSSEEEYLITSLLCSFDDLAIKLRPVMQTNIKEEEKMNKAKEFMENHAPLYLKAYENRFKQFGGRYMIGDELTLADICVTAHLYNFFINPHRRHILHYLLPENCPSLYQHISNVGQNEMKDFFFKGYIHEALF